MSAEIDPRKFSAARNIVVSEMPYLASVLYALVPHESRELKTLGVTADLRLFMNPDHIGTLHPRQFANELIHEVMHVLRDHHARGQRMSTDPADRQRTNFANDLELNDDMKDRCGPDWLLPEKFGFADGLTAEQYFDLLKSPPKAPKPGPGKPGCGECGSCAAGPPTPGEGGRDPLEVAAIRAAVAAAVQEAAKKGQGSVPAHMLRWAGETLAPPRVPWQQKLARAVRRAISYRAGDVDLSFSELSRRQWGVGYGVGRPVIAADVSPIPEVAVAIDTSGSMGTEELGQALQETQGILRAVGAPVRFIACDAAVHTDIQASDLRKVTAGLKGGGGTSFIPIFDRLAKGKRRPNVIVVCTDGYGTYPARAPSGVKVVWMMIGKGSATPPWGEVIAFG